MNVLGALFLTAVGITAFVLVLIFVLVPLFKGIGWLIGATFKAIGWLVTHIFEFIIGMIRDALRFVGAIIAIVVLIPLAMLNVVIGRWSAAGHFAESVKRELKVGALCVYRVCLQHPLKLLLLHGLLEGLEERVPEAMAAAPTRDTPGRRTGQFDGYRIVGSLKSGGSGAKLYVAEPDATVRSRHPGMPDRVVIKSFALTEGSSLPQIVRESRALECAKQLGLVFDHGMTEQRFFYVMPYHAGDHLGIITRQLHGETDGNGLDRRQLAKALGYIRNLVETLSVYHRGGLWHKDVKPENVIIHDGRAHLVDLGLITPLKSAMTLTTHGTEYFRDPEMVRQALRGVKVHQVNGAKFDIYAAGAVLYFVIENDFPAHGALSRFTRRSPEALKWIVRRAMADYSHRYESGDVMLADIQHVADASDPFAVKPADLPSMRGGDASAYEAEEPDVERVAYAGTPEPAAPGVHADGGNASPWAAPAGAVPAPQAASVAEAQRDPGRRPTLQVVNWWTGEYRVLDPGTANDPTPGGMNAGQAEFSRQQAAALRHQAAHLRHQSQRGAMSPRRAAREQVKAARARAMEMRRRLREKRGGRHHQRPLRAHAERQPTATLFGIVVATLVVMAFGVLAVGWLKDRGGTKYVEHVGATPAPTASATAGGSYRAPGPPVLLVTELADPGRPDVAAHLASLVADQQSRHDIVITDAALEKKIGSLLQWWHDSDHSREADQALEDALEAHGFYGVIRVRDTANGSLQTETLVFSERDGARGRRYLVGPAPADGGSYLFINDHPVAHDQEVKRAIESLRSQLRVRQWDVIDGDEELLAAVRSTMPPGLRDTDVSMPKLFHVELNRHDLAGVIYVAAGGGEAPGAENLIVRRIDAEPVEWAAQEVAADAEAETEPPIEAPTDDGEPEGASGAAGPRVPASAGTKAASLPVTSAA